MPEGSRVNTSLHVILELYTHNLPRRYVTVQSERIRPWEFHLEQTWVQWLLTTSVYQGVKSVKRRAPSSDPPPPLTGEEAAGWTWPSHPSWAKERIISISSWVQIMWKLYESDINSEINHQWYYLKHLSKNLSQCLKVVNVWTSRWVQPPSVHLMCDCWPVGVSLQSTCQPHMHVPASLPPTHPDSQSRLATGANAASDWSVQWSMKGQAPRTAYRVASGQTVNVTALWRWAKSWCLTGAEKQQYWQHVYVLTVWMKRILTRARDGFTPCSSSVLTPTGMTSALHHLCVLMLGIFRVLLSRFRETAWGCLFSSTRLQLRFLLSKQSNEPVAVRVTSHTPPHVTSHTPPHVNCPSLSAPVGGALEVSTHLAAEHEGDGAVGAGHLAVAQHGWETLHLLQAGGHLFGAGIVGWEPPPPGAVPTPPAPPSSGSGSPCTTSSSASSLSTSSSTAAAAAPCSHHPPSFLASLHRGGEETTPRALPSSRENLPPPPRRWPLLLFLPLLLLLVEYIPLPLDLLSGTRLDSSLPCSPACCPPLSLLCCLPLSLSLSRSLALSLSLSPDSGGDDESRGKQAMLCV